MNVTLCGPKGAIETLTPEQVVIEIDAEDFSVATGEQNIACACMCPPTARFLHWAAMCCSAASKATETKRNTR